MNGNREESASGGSVFVGRPLAPGGRIGGEGLRPNPRVAMLGLLALAAAGGVPAYRDDDRSPRGVAEPIKPRADHKAGRNDPCPCGSGKKFKRCCRS